MVRSGATLTFQVAGRTGGLFRATKESLRSGVIGSLSSQFIVRGVEVTVPTLLDSASRLELWQYSYSAIVTVTTQNDYAQVDDVASIVAHSFYVVGGALPTVTTDVHDGPFGGINYAGESPFGVIGDIGAEVANLPRLIVFGVIAVVAIIAFSPVGKAGVKLSAL